MQPAPLAAHVCISEDKRPWWQTGGITFLYIRSGSQKVLGVPPGTAPISFSPRAVQHFQVFILSLFSLGKEVVSIVFT
jgi:hypothetical protein